MLLDLRPVSEDAGKDFTRPLCGTRYEQQLLAMVFCLETAYKISHVLGITSYSYTCTLKNTLLLSSMD
jgi:hypothetical protein